MSEGEIIDGTAGEWDRHLKFEAIEGTEVILALFRVHKILLDRIDRTLRPFELTFARYELLTLPSFTRTGGLSVGALGERLQVHATSISSAVDRLEADALVVRVPSNIDRRMVTVQITPTGRQVGEEATNALNERVFSKLSLSPEQHSRLWSVLRDFRANSGDFAVVVDRHFPRARRRGTSRLADGKHGAAV